jgi:hypothetical protein
MEDGRWKMENGKWKSFAGAGTGTGTAGLEFTSTSYCIACWISFFAINSSHFSIPLWVCQQKCSV